MYTCAFQIGLNFIWENENKAFACALGEKWENKRKLREIERVCDEKREMWILIFNNHTTSYNFSLVI